MSSSCESHIRATVPATALEASAFVSKSKETLLGLAVNLLNKGESFEVHLARKKTKSELVRLSGTVCGIEFCYAAETAFVSPILMSLGLPVSLMTIVWCLSPAIGLFLAPVLGSLSDSCSSRLGRRRPFILLLSTGILLGLLLVPNGSLLSSMLVGDGGEDGNRHHLHKAWQIAFTILGTILLDLCCDACQSPARTYLLDVTQPEQQSTGLSTFTIMAGLGGSLGYLIGSVPWEHLAPLSWLVHDQVRAVFTMVTVIFVLCVTATVTSFAEDQPNQACPRRSPSDYETFSNENDDSGGEEPLELASLSRATNSSALGASPERAEYQNSRSPAFKDYLKSIIYMPRSLQLLCITNLFSWMSLVCYSLYFTDFVGSTVFLGDPRAEPGSESSVHYRSGVRFGSFAMALYSLSCAVYSYNIETLLKTFGYKTVYVCGQLAYAAGMVVLAVTRSKLAVVCCSTSAGIQYATLFTMPYLLIAKYHQTPQLLAGDITRGMGTDVATVGSMVFVAQLSLSLFIGKFIEFMGSNVATVWLAALFSACGSIFASRLYY